MARSQLAELGFQSRIQLTGYGSPDVSTPISSEILIFCGQLERPNIAEVYASLFQRGFDLLLVFTGFRKNFVFFHGQ